MGLEVSSSCGIPSLMQECLLSWNVRLNSSNMLRLKGQIMPASAFLIASTRISLKIGIPITPSPSSKFYSTVGPIVVNTKVSSFDPILNILCSLALLHCHL